MSATNGVLAMVAERPVRDDIDRVAAAAGIAVVHTSHAPSRQAWSGAAAVLVDVEGARRCAQPTLPRRGHVVLLTRAEPEAADWQAAIAVGAQRLMTLPADEAELVAVLAESAELRAGDGRKGSVVAVMAGRGGAGASLLATALSQSAHDALLIDADSLGGGIELAVGCEHESGLRWPDLVVEHGRLDIAALRQALPRRDGVSVLSATRSGGDIESTSLAAVIDAGRRGAATVVCDLPRRLTRAIEFAVDAADLMVLVTTADVRACAATTALAAAVGTINPNVGLVVRGPSPGGLRSAEVARIVDLPLLAAMRPQRGVEAMLERGGLRLRRGSPLATAARKLLKE
jgi:secretion/DNA translocation related CpaE-like protein